MAVTDSTFEGEVWKVIEEFPDYEVSSFGKVRRLTYSLRNHKPGRILKTHIDKDGYVRISLTRNRHEKLLQMHRLVASAFLPKSTDPNKNQVNHRDGVRNNNHISNLEWIDQSGNMLHSYHTLGYRQPGKYPKEIIIKIHEMRMEGIGPSKIANELGISLAHVEQVLSRRVRGKDLEGLPINYPRIPHAPRN